MTAEPSLTSAKVTISDVARASGVSPATVSLALRHKAGISSETRQRVFDAAQALGYLLQPPTRSAQRSAIHSMGVLLKTHPDDVAITQSFYGPVVAGIEEVCRRQQIHLIFANLLVDLENRPVDPPRLLFEQHTDGLLLIGMQMNRASLTLFQQQSAPIVLVDAYVESDPYDTVVTDNYAGAYAATTYLLDQGHRHIAIVGSQPQTFPSVIERRTGYHQALTEQGLQPYFWDCPLWPKAAYEACRAYLHQLPVPITAFFCCNDAVAFSLMQALQEREYRIPQDVSVIGFDNIDLAQHTTPPLTTMLVDKVGMGRLAAQLLINRIEHPAAAHVCAWIRPTLVERQSVASIAGLVGE